MKTVQQYYAESYESNTGFNKAGERNFSLSFPDGLSVYKLTADVTNVIDIIPFRIEGDNHPLVRANKVPGDGTEYDDIFMYWEHRNLNENGDSVICLNKMYGKPCPICEEMKRLASTEAEGWKSQRVKNMQPKSRVMMNIIDWKNRDAGIQVYTGSAYVTRTGILEGAKVNRQDEYDLNSQYANEADTFKITVSDWKTKSIVETEHIYFQSPTNGFGIAIPATTDTFTTDGKSYEYVKPTKFTLKPRTVQYKNDIVDKAYNLTDFLNVKTYDEVAAIFYGVEPNEEVETPDAVAPALDRPVAPPVIEQPIKTVAAQEENPELKGEKCSYGLKIGLDYETDAEICSRCVDENPKQYSKCARASKNLASL